MILEQLLRKHLLRFACRHQVLEIKLVSVFQECLGLPGATKTSSFKHFQTQWQPLSKEKSENAFTLSELGDFCHDYIINFSNLQLLQSHFLDDYQE